MTTHTFQTKKYQQSSEIFHWLLQRLSFRCLFLAFHKSTNSSDKHQSTEQEHIHKIRYSLTVNFSTQIPYQYAKKIEMKDWQEFQACCIYSFVISLRMRWEKIGLVVCKTLQKEAKFALKFTNLQIFQLVAIILNSLLSAAGTICCTINLEIYIPALLMMLSLREEGVLPFERPDPAVICMLAGYASVCNSHLDQVPSFYLLSFTVCLHLLQLA